MYYITADPHGDWRSIRRFAQEHRLTADDTIIVLGDAGVNYFFNQRDEDPRREIAKIEASVFCNRALNAGVETNGHTHATLDELIENNKAWKESCS